jgi:hypothetical protein
MNKDYQPVSRDFFEALELLADLRKPCEIVFRSENGARTVIRDKITALYDREGREWLRTGSGMEIGLDKVEQVDGKMPSNYC